MLFFPRPYKGADMHDDRLNAKAEAHAVGVVRGGVEDSARRNDTAKGADNTDDRRAQPPDARGAAAVR